MAEDEMVGWHHQLNGDEFEQTLGDSEGQGSLACCSPWSHKQLDMTERLNNNNVYMTVIVNVCITVITSVPFHGEVLEGGNMSQVPDM